MPWADYFDHRAARFGAWYRNEWLTRLLGRGAIIDRLRYAVDVAANARARRVIDVGCGTGPLFEPLAKNGIKVVGIDPAENMTSRARAEARRVGQGVSVRTAGWESLVGGAREFDLAVALGVFDYVCDPVAALDAMRTVAGAVVASFPNASLRRDIRQLRYGRRGVKVFGYTESELSDIFNAAGLEILECIQLGRSGFIVYAREGPIR